MDNEELAEARARTQDAESRARLATDPQTKKQWEELAERWKTRLAALQAAKNVPRKRNPPKG